MLGLRRGLFLNILLTFVDFTVEYYQTILAKDSGD